MFNEKKELLIQKLNFIIDNTDARSIKEQVYIELKQRNLPTEITSLATQIIIKNASVEQLVNNDDIKALFFFAHAIKKSLGENTDIKINLEDYFNKSEIEDLQNYKIEVENESIFPIVLKDINFINEHHWEGVISAQELARLNDAKAIIYNPRTQRNPKITKKGAKINVNSNKVLAIKNDLVNGVYEPDHIKLNILKDGNERFEYNQKNRTLKIFEGTTINIVDGQHRSLGNSSAVAVKPDLSIRWGITVYNTSEVRAHDIMVQINKQTKMPDEWIQTKDYSRNENNVISIMADERCNLFKIMKEDEKSIQNNLALVKKSNIAEAIKENYGEMILDNDDRRQVGKWLAEFFDYMLKLYSSDFLENPYEVKKDSFINWKNTFYGYVALSKELYEQDDWRDTFKSKMQSIDFKNTNPMWQNIGMLKTTDANATLRKTLYNLFREGVE